MPTGVIGGQRGVVLEFLDRVIQLLDRTPPEANCNMAAVNYVAHKFFYERTFTGYPLTR